MRFIEFRVHADAALTLAVVARMFVLFLGESYSTEVIAIGGVAVLLATRALQYQQALTILANPAPWRIASMFNVMEALVRTSALEAFANFAESQAKTNPALAISLLIGFVVLASAFVSNTPVVVVMMPVFIKLARSLILRHQSC